MLKSVVFPADWTTIPFGRVAPRVQDSGRPDLESLSVFLGAGVVPRSSREDNHNQLGEDMGKYLVVEPGDIVFNKLRTWQGGLGASKYLGLVSPAYFVCRPKASFDPTFLQYLLLSSTYLQELTRISKWQPPSQFDIGWEQLKLLPIVAPDLARQKAISDYLDRETTHIDRLINKKRRMIELLNERMRVTVETIIKGDFTSLYPVVPLRHIARFNYGDSLAAEDRIEGDVLVYGSNGPVGTHVCSNTSKPVLVVGRKGSYGKVQYCADGVFAIDTTYYIDRSSCSQNLRWLYFALQTVGLDTLSQDVGIPGLSRESAYRVKVPLPEPSRQSEIANELNTKLRHFESLVGAITQEIDLLVERRQVLITAAITGELEIPEVAA